MVQTALALVYADLVADVKTSTDGKLYPLGTKREEDGKIYRYVEKGAGATAAVNGKLAYHQDGDFKVTATAADTDDGLVAGVWMSVIAASGFGWIMVRGRKTLTTSGVDDIIKGDALIGDAAAAGGVRRAVLTVAGTTGAEVRAALDMGIVARALADDVDAADTVDAYVVIE